MCHSARSTCFVVLAVCLAALVAAAPCLAQTEAPHLDGDGERFPVMMWKTVDAPAHEDPYRGSVARIDSIWRGHPGGHEACNVVTFGDGQYFCDPSWDPVKYPREEWPDSLITLFLEPLRAYNDSTGADVKIVLGQLYRLFVSASPDEFLCVSQKDSAFGFKDHHLVAEGGRDLLENYLTVIGSWEKETENAQGLIAGWMLTDEPELWGCDLAAYYHLVDAVRSIEDSLAELEVIGAPHPLHVDLHARSAADGFNYDFLDAVKYKWINYNGEVFTTDKQHIPPGLPSGTVCWDSIDQRVVRANRFPSGPEGIYQGKLYYTLWEADVVHINYYKPLEYVEEAGNWGEWVAQAREDFEEHGQWQYGGPSTADDWNLHLVIPAFQVNMFPDNEDMHRYIRHVLDLNPDGIGFWNWRPQWPNGTEPAGKGYWFREHYDWAEAVENEMEGAD